MAVSNVELRVNATQAVNALKKVDTQSKKFNTTISGTSGKLKATTGSFKALPAGLLATGAGAKTAAGGFVTLQAALAPILSFLVPITAGITLLTKAFDVLSKQDFAVARVKTLGVNVDELNPKLAALSNELSGQASKLDLLTASYDLASAGFTKTSEVTDILKASQLGATGGFSDLNTVTDATTSVLNAFGLEADKASRVVDGFAQTQADGKIVVDQYAQQIGRLAPIAAGAGVSLEELNAAISTITAQGVPVESTFAGLRQAFSSIQKPTAEASRLAEKLGIDFSAAALKSKGLPAVLQEIVDKGGASAENLSILFGSVEALTAIQPLLNDELVKFNQNLENQSNAQGRAARDAFIAGNTIQGQLKRIGSAFTNLLGEGSEFGVVIREVLKVTAVTLEALGIAVKATFAPFRALFAFISEIGKAVTNEFGGEAIDIVIFFEEAWIKVKKAIDENLKLIVELGRKAGQVIGKLVKAIFGALKKIIEFVEKDPVLGFLLGQIQKIFPKVEIEVESKQLKNLNEELEETDENAKKLKEAFEKIGETIEQSIVSNLADAVEGTKTLAEAAVNVLNRLKRALIELAIQQAVSGIGAKIGGFLTSVFVGGFGGGGGNKLDSQALGKAASVQTGIPLNLKEGSFNITKRALGGTVSAGGAFLVGENGPELLQMGSRGGNIIPNNALGGSSITNLITVNVDANSSNVTGKDAEANQLGNQIAIAIQSELIRQKRAGGLLA